MRRQSPADSIAQRKTHKVLHEFKEGTLHSGSSSGPVVTDRKQALAIALNSGRRAAKKKRRKPY